MQSGGAHLPPLAHLFVERIELCAQPLCPVGGCAAQRKGLSTNALRTVLQMLSRSVAVTVAPLTVLRYDCINDRHVRKPPPLRFPDQLRVAALACTQNVRVKMRSSFIN